MSLPSDCTVQPLRYQGGADADGEGQSGVWRLIVTCMHAQSCPVLCDPTDCSPPGSSVLGIFQARTLEWVAVINLGQEKAGKVGAACPNAPGSKRTRH